MFATATEDVFKIELGIDIGWWPWVLVGAAIVFALTYQYKDAPDYPIRWGNWFAIAWMVAGVALTAWIARARPRALEAADRVFVEDETVAVP